MSAPASSSVTRRLLELGWPMMLSTVLVLLDSANLRFWLGRYFGKEGLAIHTATAPLLALVNLPFMAICTGCGVAVARSIGARDGRGLSLAANAVTLAGVVWLVVIAVLVPCSGPIAELLAKDGMSPAKLQQFMIPWLVVAQPMFALVMLLITTVSSAGWTSFALRQGAIHLALSMCLMPLSLGPLDLGYAGPSLALALTTAINCVLLWRMLEPQMEARFLSAKIDRTLLFRRDLWRQIVEVGFPVQLARAAAYVVTLVVMLEVRGAGVPTLAGWGIAMVYVEIGGAISGGFSGASQILMAQRLGANDPAGARRALSVSLFVGLMFPAVATTTLVVLARPAVRVFSDNPEVLEQGVRCIHLLVWLLFPAAIWQILLGAFGAAQATKRAFLITLAAQGLALAFVWTWTGDRVVVAAVTMVGMYGLSASFFGLLAIPVLWRGALRRT